MKNDQVDANDNLQILLDQDKDKSEQNELDEIEQKNFLIDSQEPLPEFFKVESKDF